MARRKEVQRAIEQQTVYLSSPRLVQRRFPARCTTIKNKQQPISDTAATIETAYAPTTKSKRKYRAVQFAIEEGLSEEDGSPKRSRASRSRSIGDSQRTLTQIEFIRQDSDLSTTTGTRKRKRRTPQPMRKAQTTITQMPLVRSYNSRSEIEDHLGYESELWRIRNARGDQPKATPLPSTSRGAAPVPDSEDEDDNIDLDLDDGVAAAIAFAGSPLSSLRGSISPPPVGLDISPNETASESRSFLHGSESFLRTPKRTRGIASSQSPALTPMSVGKHVQPIHSERNADRSPSLQKQCFGSQQSPVAERSPLRRSPRNALRPLTASQNNVLMSPARYRDATLPKRDFAPIEKGFRRSMMTGPRPRLIASSTKVSTLSSYEPEADEYQTIVATPSYNADGGLGDLDRIPSSTPSQGLPGNSQGGPDHLPSKPHKDPDFGGGDRTPSGQPLSNRTERRIAGVFRSSAGVPDSQDEASAQLLLETQACFDRSTGHDLDAFSRSSQNAPATSTPGIRPSQATTVGTSPLKPTQYSTDFDRHMDDSVPILVPSSPAKSNRNESILPIASFGTESTARPGYSSPSLRRPSSIGIESSPVLQQPRDKFTSYEESQFVPTTQLPPSLLGESIPPPPLWSDD